MTKETFSKFIAAAILATLMALAIHTDHENRRQAGREAFIAKETLRWDQHYTAPDSVPADIMGALMGSIIAFSAYETLAFGILLIVKRISVDDAKHQSPAS